MFGVILGTGVGGGMVAGGRVEGRNAIAGEWGHNALPWIRADELPGPPCGCGKPGHASRGFFRARASRELAAGAGERWSRRRFGARRFRRLRPARPGALEERLARALASVINLIDPDAIVLGGGLSNAARLYRNVASLLPRHVYSDSVTTPIVPAAHGDASGVDAAQRASGLIRALNLPVLDMHPVTP